MLVFVLYSSNLWRNLLFCTPCSCILWLTCDEINQIKLCLLRNWTSCSCQALLPSLACHSQIQVSNLSSNLFNKDIFQGETISCGLWFKFTICQTPRVCMSCMSLEDWHAEKEPEDAWTPWDRHGGVKWERQSRSECVHVSLLENRKRLP